MGLGSGLGFGLSSLGLRIDQLALLREELFGLLLGPRQVLLVLPFQNHPSGIGATLSF